jgi:hypothetical protein
MGEIQRLWSDTDPTGTVGAIPRHLGHRIDRSNHEVKSQCIFHLSYMAKQRGKQYGKGLGVINHGASRLLRHPATAKL